MQGNGIDVDMRSPVTSYESMNGKKISEIH